MTSLRRSLGLFGVFAIASGAMISSGLFILPGLAHAQAGPAVVLSYLIAGLITIPGMLSIAEMSSAMPKAGADAFSVMRSLGPGVGTVAGLLSRFSLSMKSAFALVGLSVLTTSFLDVWPPLVGIVFAAVFLLINFIGAREAGRAQAVLVLLLLALMGVFVVTGFRAVDHSRCRPFAPGGIVPVLSTAGFVFVSYAGLIYVASIAEEIKRPGRNIPLGMFLSLIVVSALYALMVYVTSGVLDAEALHRSLTPISDAAGVFLGDWGRYALSAAAVLAFLSTANAGIMTAARSLVPLSRDRLFPPVFATLHPRFGTPWVSLVFTGALIIVSLFVRLRILVEAASLVVIITNMLACVSLIVIRYSHLQGYRPTFRTPLFPWIQALGAAVLLLLIFEMGLEAIVISLVLAGAGTLAYLLYGRRIGYQEYALLHLIERISDRKLTRSELEKELRHILRERDEIETDRFDAIVEKALVIDMEGPATVEMLFDRVSSEVAPVVRMEAAEVRRLLEERESQSHTAISDDIAVPHLILPGTGRFSLVLVRCREGIRFSEDATGVRAVFVLAGSRDERNFHLVSLVAIAQAVKKKDFISRWMQARDGEALRSVVLLARH